MDTLCHPTYRYIAFFVVVSGVLKYSFKSMTHEDIIKTALVGTAVIYAIDYVRQQRESKTVEKMSSETPVSKMTPVASVTEVSSPTSVPVSVSSLPSPVPVSTSIPNAAPAATMASLTLMPVSVSQSQVTGVSEPSAAVATEVGSPVEAAFSEPSLTGLPAVQEVVPSPASPTVDVEAPTVAASVIDAASAAVSDNDDFLPGLGGDNYYDLAMADSTQGDVSPAAMITEMTSEWLKEINGQLPMALPDSLCQAGKARGPVRPASQE